jgi:hypothetical protein
LAGIDPDTLDGTALSETVVELQRQQARLAAEATRLSAALEARRVWGDDGSRSCGAWLAHRCRLRLGQARAQVWLGRRLRTMPATAEAFGAGDISQRHASVLASLAGGRVAGCFARDEVVLVGFARTMGWVEFCRAVEYRRQCADPDGAERDAAGDEALRRVHLSPGLRGTGHLDGLLTSLGRATLASALGRIEQELFEADWAVARAEHGDAAQSASAHLARTPGQRRHDALVELARRAMTAPGDGKRPRPLVSVLVGYETFRGRVCELADHVVVTPGTVASLLDEALIERVVFDGPSRVIDLGGRGASAAPCAGRSTPSIGAAPTPAATCPSSAARATTSSPGHAAGAPTPTTASSAAPTTTAGAGNTPTATPQRRPRNDDHPPTPPSVPPTGRTPRSRRSRRPCTGRGAGRRWPTPPRTAAGPTR